MLKLFQGIYRFFRWVREFTVTLVFLLFVMAFFSFTALLNSSENKKLPNTFRQGALTLNLDGYIRDNHDEMGDFYRLLRSELNQSDELKISLFDVVRVIKKAQKDPKITGIVLDLRYFAGGDIPSLRFIRQALEEFKVDKPVIAIGESYTQRDYYLASVANEIYLNKAGEVALKGLSYQQLFFKALFDKIEAVPHIFRVGTYKAAVEPFMRNEMSDEAKANANRWLNSIWSNMLNDMGKSRGVEPKKMLPPMKEYVTAYRNAQADDAQFALNAGWVTHLVTSDEMLAMLQEKFGKDDENGYQQVDYFDYEATLTDRFDVNSPNKIAVVNVEGNITGGESETDSVGSDTVVRLLQRVRDDETVQGVILRVNSPGGSAVASELIRQEVVALQKSGRPVVVSMGGMAASGGYWISANADKIVADPDTITGSIGIFGLAVTFEKTAKNLGVQQDGIATSELAEMGGLKTISSAQSELLQTSVDFGYQRFIQLVSDGRELPLADVENVAQGQVWSGQDALTHGLVDQLGDFNDAYDQVVELINTKRQMEQLPELKQLDIQWYIDDERSLFGSFMRGVKGQVKTLVSQWLGLPPAVKNIHTPLDLFNDPKQLYLYCELCGQIN